ncbi:MAG TPA: 1-(5-phosphoribosyl)-5-[(5-phosphoribosylamino)methylideneamino]imidazole-4-carboxamide isomerase [Woeseiaceae bacterium]|nr:1-(5-phosphoribosyl)-5-[(5-phosphoribosylamino)methylideneamino]imidazole-4-carboxamide isomerase [Woeseiaceae bacterium]
MRIIPAIDLRGGRCVRLEQGDFARETVYSDDPLAVARRFGALAVSELHVVDLDGARTGTQANTDVIRDIVAGTPLEIQLGGGIRSAERLEHWFATGVRRCVLGSLAVTAPEQVRRWLCVYGGDRIVLALDVSLRADGEPMLATDGWTRTTETSLWECLDGYLEAGLRHVLCTDISRDGALAGPNVELYQRVLARYAGLKLQASGGVRHAEDLRSLARAGVPAAITGRALLDGRIAATEVASFRPSA